jgi:hypothetical protein
MKRIQLDISRFQKKEETTKKRTISERATLIGQFLEILNADRNKSGFPPLKAARLAMMLSPIKTKDLYAFLADCKYASHFSKFFWSRFKV